MGLLLLVLDWAHYECYWISIQSAAHGYWDTHWVAAWNRHSPTLKPATFLAFLGATVGISPLRWGLARSADKRPWALTRTADPQSKLLMKSWHFAIERLWTNMGICLSTYLSIYQMDLWNWFVHHPDAHWHGPSQWLTSIAFQARIQEVQAAYWSPLGTHSFTSLCRDYSVDQPVASNCLTVCACCFQESLVSSTCFHHFTTMLVCNQVSLQLCS